jgi:L-fucose isomerase-like protein
VDSWIIQPDYNVSVLAANLKRYGVQAVEIHLGNYGCEHEVAELLRQLDVPALIFAPYDGPPNADGTRDTDGWCGVMPMTKLVSDYGGVFDAMPHSMPGSELEIAKFGQFARIARGVRAVRDVRIGQIGGDQPTFEAIKSPPEVLSIRFGVEVVHLDASTFFKRIQKLEETEDAMLAAEVEAMVARGVDVSEVPPQNMKRVMAALVAELELCLEHNLAGITHNCWPACMEEHQLMLCMVGGELLRNGVPYACETDRGGLLSQMILQALNPDGLPPMFADITIAIWDVVNERWIILVWHCGPAASSICLNCKACQGWIIPTAEPAYAFLDGLVEAKGTATLARFCNWTGSSGIGFELAAFEAPIVPGPKTKGTHFWVAPNDFPGLEEQLLLGDYAKPWLGKSTVHHFGVGFGEYAHLLQGVARYLGVPSKILRPGEEEVRNRRLCRGLSFLV